MTSHGFGGVRIKSKKLTPKMIADLARQISNIKPIVWAHVVLDRSASSERKENERYAIIFEFDELDKECYEMNHSELRGKIEGIRLPGHEITADLWVIQRSYHNGC